MLTRLQARRFSTPQTYKVINDVAKQQFKIALSGGENAVLDYQLNGNQITLVHTEVSPACIGKGIGKVLAKHAFDHALEKDLNVTCQCHFLAKYYLNNRDQYKNINVTIEDEPTD